MKTADLISALAAEATPRPAGVVRRRLTLALVGGGVITLALVILWLGRQPLSEAARHPWFWIKASYTAALMVPAALMVARLSRPGARLGLIPAAPAAVVLIMLGLGFLQLSQTPPELWVRAVRGATWSYCSPYIVLLSVPIFLPVAFAMRTFAPTRPGLAGAAAGFVSAALAATLYGLHCREQGAAFVATWYTLAVAVAAGLGGLCGRWVLRW